MFRLNLNNEETIRGTVTVPTCGLAVELGQAWCQKGKGRWFHVSRLRYKQGSHHPIVGDAFKAEVLTSPLKGWKRVF